MALNTGINVVCDRYASANQVHQGGKISDEDRRREFMAWLDKLEFEIFGIPQPDVSIYLDVPPAVSEGNMSDKLRDEVEKNPDYIRNSYKSAQWLMRNYPEKWIHIKCADGDTMRTREEIHQEVLAALRLRHIL
jgi:dTMP kinase